MRANNFNEPDRDTNAPDRFLFGAVGVAALAGILVGAMMGAFGGALYYAFDDRAAVWLMMIAGALFGAVLGGVIVGTQIAGPFDHK